MGFKLNFGALRALRGYLAEYIASQAFQRWIVEKHPKINKISWSSPLFPPVKIWVPPPLVVGPRYEEPTTRSIYHELLMPELKPLYKIHSKGGSFPDLVAEVRLGVRKIERYFIEVKSGEATLDERQKLSLSLARDEGYIPIVVRVKSMDLERNSFDVKIEEAEAMTSK